jgi:hypothetical protein
MLDRGEVESMADLARLGRVSRARITQIMDLLMFAPEIQEALLFSGREVRLRDAASLARYAEWADQLTASAIVLAVRTDMASAADNGVA